MKNKQQLIKIGDAIRNSDIKQTSRYKTLINNIGTMKAIEAYETIIELCLQSNIDCQVLINRGAEYRDSKLSEEEFKKMIHIVLV